MLVWYCTQDAQKKTLRDLFVSCTKIDVGVNNIVSRARLINFSW